MHLSPDPVQVLQITVGSRASPLAQAQLVEVHEEIRKFQPSIQFTPVLVKTTGDLDRTTSLRDMGKTDFFTKEIEQLQLSGGCRISIHSAKDLPEKLMDGLKIVAITQGITAADSLVLRNGDTLAKLPSQAVIATSSVRREEAVKRLRHDLRFVDLRGLIEERLQRLMDKEVDGVVVAEAALRRLQLMDLNHLRLPGHTTPLQGQLAVVALKDDVEMEELFAPIDTRITL
jgi:hydroxymethylbilane synthase